MIKRGISLTIAPRNSSDPANSNDGSHAQDQVAIGKPRPKKPTNKYEQFVTIAPQNRGPKTGFQTLPTSRTM